MVNNFIRQQTATNFEGLWLLVAEWNNVAEYGSSADRVRVGFNQRFFFVMFLEMFRPTHTKEWSSQMEVKVMHCLPINVDPCLGMEMRQWVLMLVVHCLKTTL